MDNETFSFVASFSNNYDRLNDLLDDTINDICHQVHAYATSNESFMYLQMLREKDHKQFFEAMEVALADHKFCNHWTLMERKDLPIRTKMIMAILSFKHKQFPDGTLNKHKARLCAHGGQQLGDRIIGIHIHPLSLGPVFIYFSLLQKFMVFNRKILCLLFHRRIWMSQFIWNSCRCQPSQRFG
jgi:hypothetical protein